MQQPPPSFAYSSPDSYQPQHNNYPAGSVAMAAQATAWRQMEAGSVHPTGGGGAPGEEIFGRGGAEAFSDRAVRRNFIRKVYGILFVQLLVTMGLITPFIFHEGLRQFVLANRWLMWAAFGVTFVCLIAMSCCESVRRNTPTNYIFLGVFTLCEGFMMGTISAAYQRNEVMLAVGICAGVSLALTLFAFQTKYDFTTCGGMLCGMLVVLMIAGFMMIFMPYNKWAVIAYGSAGALIFSMYIVYDTQLMLGGKHKYSISPEEYIFAALNLYLDVVNLFMFILQIVGAANSE